MDFARRVLDILNDGALALMLSIGHRAGLFDTMARLDWATSEELADEAGLVERYVREWLGAMVTGAIVDYDPARRAYRLPKEHAGLLTRDARPSNAAAAAQWIPLLGSVEDRVLACFERGGGVPDSAYRRFQQVMAEGSELTVVAALEPILSLVPGCPGALERGIDVLDVGCGGGRALNELAASHPRSRFTGYDVSVEAVGRARAEARERRLANVAFELRDAADLRAESAFDLVTAFDAIHHQSRPARVLAAIARALRPGGAFLMQEVAGTGHVHEDAAHPLAPFLYTVSCLHCMTVTLVGDGAGLGSMWGAEAARRMLAEAGFGAPDVHVLPHDPMNVYWVAHPL
jgi:2-polyprenyl-3-methyl-5-hydroxy-6-metoxy-1,4-benzoquinol methylase